LLAPFKTSDGHLRIQGIFCPNESTAFGMLRALQDADLAGRVHFVGFDSSDKLNRALKDGQIDALVVQNPMRIAYLGVKTLVEHISGTAVPSKVDVAAMLVTRDNMQSAQISELLHPNISRWIDD
jgi:ribose transport system substrate-binding protein